MPPSGYLGKALRAPIENRGPACPASSAIPAVNVPIWHILRTCLAVRGAKSGLATLVAGASRGDRAGHLPFGHSNAVPHPISDRGRIAVDEVRPGAEPFQYDGDTDVAVLLIHGFTGSPASMPIRT